VEVSEESDSLPLPVTCDVSTVVAEIQRELLEITGPTSPGGRHITTGERVRVDEHMARLKELVCRQLQGAIERCSLGRTG
jgi:hypothetical protein